MAEHHGLKILHPLLLLNSLYLSEMGSTKITGLEMCTFLPLFAKKGQSLMHAI